MAIYVPIVMYGMGLFIVVLQELHYYYDQTGRVGRQEKLQNSKGDTTRSRETHPVSYIHGMFNEKYVSTMFRLDSFLCE